MSGDFSVSGILWYFYRALFLGEIYMTLFISTSGQDILVSQPASLSDPFTLSLLSVFSNSSHL